MDIKLEIDVIKRSFEALSCLIDDLQRTNHALIEGMVTMHQNYRIAKEYRISDEIREILHNAGIEIIQGTKQYGGYESIPRSMKGRQINDTWEVKK